MSFDLLPDADKYPQPRFTWFLACLFNVVVGKLYRIETVIPRDCHLVPGSLIISNHLRDSDVPVLTVALCRREGWRFREPLPIFAAREDLFQRDVLATLGWPSPLSRLLGWVPVGSLLRSLGARPLRRLREFTFADTLAELTSAGLGALRPVELFNARGQRELIAHLGELPRRVAAIEPRQLGRLRCSNWGLRRLRLATLRRIEGTFRASVSRQLDGFVASLDAGRVVYMAPEGVLSRSGRCGRVRAGPRLLCRRARAAVTILPTAISYDPLRSGRLRVLVRVGEPMGGGDSAQLRHFDSSLRHAILRLPVVTTSHLIAWFLRAGPGQFTTPQLVAWLHRGVDIAAAGGLTVDPLLQGQPLQALAEKRLRWLRRRRLVRRHGALWDNSWPRQTEPGWSDAAGIVAFLANALADLGPDWYRQRTP